MASLVVKGKFVVVISAIFAVLLPLMFIAGICVSYLLYLLSGSEGQKTRVTRFIDDDSRQQVRFNSTSRGSGRDDKWSLMRLTWLPAKQRKSYRCAKS
jgi:hypothetical protein